MNTIDIFSKIEQYLIKIRTEPKIRKKSDHKGNYYWQVYNPNSGKYSYFASESEVKSWLD